MRSWHIAGSFATVCGLASHLTANSQSVSETRVLPPKGSVIDPYPYLNGGEFTGPNIPYTPDPLARYQWSSGVNESILQVFYLLPQNVTLMPGTSPASFVGWESLLQPWPFVTVSGVGSLQFDFGVENAAWLEFDSPDFAPGSADINMAISEYNEYGIYNLVGLRRNASGVNSATLPHAPLPPPFKKRSGAKSWESSLIP